MKTATEFTYDQIYLRPNLPATEFTATEFTATKFTATKFTGHPFEGFNDVKIEPERGVVTWVTSVLSPAIFPD